MEKTKNYDLFKFRDDNRDKIDKTHIKKLVESIKAKNLLEFRPILVNASMEVIDGQHRLLAAKELGIDIYYQVQKDLDSKDILLISTSKAWTFSDYLNYYCKNHYPEYLKLQSFMKKNGLRLRVALGIVWGRTKQDHTEFKNGLFTFSDENVERELEICWETIDYIRRMNGHSVYTESSRFWRALLKLISHSDFDKAKWKNNLKRLVNRLGVRATTEEYLKNLMEIYNWHNTQKINLE